MPDTLPDYDPHLRAFHAAFAPELTAAVQRYRLPADARVLDVPCGDGFYVGLFARAMPDGTLVAADKSPAYLARAKAAVPPSARVEFVQADAYKLPFDDASFDLVWCAQSMISLADPTAAVREMARMVKPGGLVAVYETDEFHHVLLPWPVKLEARLFEAVRAASRREYGRGDKLSQARTLRAVLLTAGLTPARHYTFAADREAPFDPAAREFLTHHFAHLRELARPELTAADAAEFDRLTDPANPDGLLSRDDVEFTCLSAVAHGRR